jgi:hypothetical protein
MRKRLAPRRLFLLGASLAEPWGLRRLVPAGRLTVNPGHPAAAKGAKMTGQSLEKQKFKLSIEVTDARELSFPPRKVPFELKRRFPMLQVRVCDMANLTRHEVTA